MGSSPQPAAGRAREPNERQIRHWNKKCVAWGEKKTLREGRILNLCRPTLPERAAPSLSHWGRPRGQTPVLPYNFDWKTLSLAAGLTVWNGYFRLYPSSIKKAPVRDFLQSRVWHRPGLRLLL
jgi:hypothetical protein